MTVEGPIHLSVCVPTLDVRNGRADRLYKSARDTIPAGIRWEFVMTDCKGELRGYTQPMNEAMARARGDFLLAVNDDVILTPGWLDTLIDPFCQPTIEWAAARPIRPGRVWCVTPDATHTDGPQVFAPYCMLWSRVGWEAIGGLDERFILWCSDIDLAKRLILADRPPVRVKLKDPIRHDLNATTGEHPELGRVCQDDIERFRVKWGVAPETAKQEMAAS